MSLYGFLFWNVHCKTLENRISRIASSFAVDVVILIEPAENDEPTLVALTPHGFRLVSDPLSRIRIYSRVADAKFTTSLDDARWQILAVQFPKREPVLLVVAHLPSKSNGNDYDQLNASIELSNDIRAQESTRCHDRTILVGDLNMNPFEPGITMTQGLNATSTQQVAERETRTVQRRKYPMFYNPMWGTFGDRTPGPPGTYYRSAGQAINYHWNVYDQLLLRPSVMAMLEDLRILDSDGEQSLLTANNLPDDTAGSDHLPLYFQLNWDKLRG